MQCLLRGGHLLPSSEPHRCHIAQTNQLVLQRCLLILTSSCDLDQESILSRLQQRFSDLVDAFDGEADDADAGLEHEPALSGSGREEVRLTLAALGYEALEIQRAMRAVAARGQGPDGEDLPDDPDGWIRACLRWLSRDAA